MDYHSVYACNDETVKFSFICKIFNIFLRRFYISIWFPNKRRNILEGLFNELIFKGTSTKVFICMIDEAIRESSLSCFVCMVHVSRLLLFLYLKLKK